MKKYVIALGAAALMLSGCGGTDASAEGFSIDGTFTGTAQSVNESGQSCQFYDGWFRAGLPVVLKGADGTILGKSELTVRDIAANPGGGGICSFNFSFKDVKAGESAYELQIADLAPIVQSESDLREWPNYKARNAIDVVAGDTAQVKQNPRPR
ncbi:hypothetical protein IU438_04790 [Nocardia cyriacigeorgica]|uniref:hypothetical protein n=1 Tax=Nocardia cyriacigeorgica TaxID=135487 RepID=UPI001892F4B0|nr:hypothetical protein [Nocardia cyriacigeorgica]MBF6161360.1 hypothetical protein [Nocardia cyriacigeorgica]MBF6200215.1 hypothetical protein [Nocardia cyriacigeorgica]MBF6395100.1 hypothetical protein [Nocardia cyriacigeorgica]MBF6400733.1 hypothetical protein [Nocardia cyriacigeorgica]